MSTSAAQLRFAVEFATFLVAVAGAVIMLLRPSLVGAERRARGVLTLGFFSVAIAAFLHGSLLTDARETPVIAFRGAGLVLLGIGTLGWGEIRRTRQVLWVALVLMASAESATVLDAATAADWLRGLGALAMGFVLILSARGSISARIAVSVGAILLVVVLAVSVALSVVIADNVEREAIRRIDGRARAESQEIEESARRDAISSAKLAALSIQGTRSELIVGLAADPTSSPARDVVARDIRALAEQDLLATDGPLLYATDTRAVVVAMGIDQVGANLLVGSRAVTEVLENRVESSGSVEVVGNQALAVGVHRVVTPSDQGPRAVAVVVATTALDEAYLNLRAQNDPAVTLAVADRDHRLAAFGRDLPESAVVDVARRALREDGLASTMSAGSFLAARAVVAPDGAPVVAIVASVPTTIVDNTRTSLFRSLFIVALVAALAAFVVAVLVGERIGTGIRRLTKAAAAIRAGDLSQRAAVSSSDEVGVLGETFDSMAGAIESLAAELRQTADEEAQVRNRLEAVVAGMGEALLAVGPTGRITTFNGAAEELFGVPATDALGRNVGDVVKIETEDGQDVSERLSHPPETGWGFAAIVSRADGARIPVALSAGGLHGTAGHLAGGVYVLRDMRKEREAERAKGELLSNISHELRTPLVPIKGYAELLLRRKVPAPKAKESLEEIVEAADRLDLVVQRLLDVASQETGPLDVRREPIVVRDLLESVAKRWKTRVDDRHPIGRRVARDLPDVLGDRRLLERCLDELMDNAVKFSPEGGPVTITAERITATGEGPAGEVVGICVRDVGIGIPEERLGGIFEDFSQADSSPTRRFGGLGLGLALVRRVVASHGGELRCETELGGGSAFTVVLPAGVPEGASQAPREPAGSRRGASRPASRAGLHQEVRR